MIMWNINQYLIRFFTWLGYEKPSKKEYVYTYARKGDILKPLRLPPSNWKDRRRYNVVPDGALVTLPVDPDAIEEACEYYCSFRRLNINVFEFKDFNVWSDFSDWERLTMGMDVGKGEDRTETVWLDKHGNVMWDVTEKAISQNFELGEWQINEKAKD